jgi:hypothetical protein
MENQSDSVSAAIKILERYKQELSRLEAQKRGVENKIASTAAKIEAAEEFVAVARSMAAAPDKRPQP